ncbi:MAG: hypothetical protein K8R99_08190 [Actinomycetia bacterium]|nr:hypothetical protein [Actinomycetes bacterium]
MGTSRSFRVPATPRWQAFVAALLGESPDRARSELFNASEEWVDALASPSVASYADSLSRLFDTFSDKLAASDRPAVAIAEAITQAKLESRERGLSSADVFAERAFASVVLETVGGAAGQGPDVAQSAATRWTATRGDFSDQLVGQFAGAVFREFATHFADREAGALVEAGKSARATARATVDLSDRVAHIAARVWTRERPATALPAESWSRFVAATLVTGAALPERDL